MTNRLKASILLFCALLGLVTKCKGQCNLTPPASTPTVYENCPNGTIVDYGTWEGDASSRTLTLDSTLSTYFVLNGEELRVGDGTLITRNLPNPLIGNILCQPAGGPPQDKTQIISIEKINSLNPIIFQSTNIEAVPEDKDKDQQIGKIIATDEDADISTYIITSQIPDEGAFRLSTNNKEGLLFLNKALDYETCSSYTLTINATSKGFDNLGNDFIQKEATVIVITVDDVDEYDPRFSCPSSDLPPIYSAVVSREAEVGEVLEIIPCDIQANDLDTGINSDIRYELLPQDGADFFAIEQDTGVISLSQSLESLDDTSGIISIYVKATEVEGGRSTTTYATVSVTTTATTTAASTTATESDVNIVQGVDETLFYALVGALGGLALLLLVLLIYACCRRNLKEVSEAADILSLHSSQNGFTNDVTIEDETVTGQETTSLDENEEEEEEEEEEENEEDNKDGEEDKEEEKDEEEPKEDDTVEEKQEEEKTEEDEEENANLYETIVDVAPAAAVATAAVVTFAADVKDTDSMKSDDDDKDEPPANEESYDTVIISPAAKLALATAATANQSDSPEIPPDDSDIPRSPSILYSNRGKESVFTSNKYDTVYKYNYACQNGLVQLNKVLKDGEFTKTHISTMTNFGEDNQSVKIVEKILKNNGTEDERKQVIAAIEIMQRVCEQENDNILYFYGAYDAVDELRYALSYVPNGSLVDNLKRGETIAGKKFDAYDLVDIIAGVAKGMRFLHAKDIVHGNLRAEHIFLDSNFVPKLHKYKNNQDCWKPDGEECRWQAIEVLKGEKCIAESDVWSFGVVMWEITSLGKKPFENIKTNDVKTFVLGNGRLERPESCSSALFAVMLNCWKIEAKQRPDFNILQGIIAEKQTENAQELIPLPGAEDSFASF